MKRQYLLLMGMCFPLLFQGFTQEDDSDRKEKESKKEEVKSDKKDRFTTVTVDNDLVFKFDVLHILFNEVNLGIEHRISNKASIEFEGGPTISNVNLVGDNFAGNGLYENSMFGYFVSAAYRFYPLDGFTAFNGFYFSPVAKYKVLNTRFEDRYSDSDFPNYSALPSRVGQWNQASFTLNFGYQMWLSKKFSIDYYAGLGLGYRTNTTYAQEFTVDQQSFDMTSNWKRTDEEGARYVITIGLKVGIGEKIGGKRD